MPAECLILVLNIGLACHQEVRQDGALRRGSSSESWLRSASEKGFRIRKGFLNWGFR